MITFYRKFAQTAGFSLSEVLASITLMCLFVAVGLQAMVSAVGLEVKSDKNQQADTWIQSDLETVYLIAANQHPPKQLSEQARFCQNYGQALAEMLGESQITQTFTTDRITYVLTREVLASNDPSIMVLQYQVSPQNGGAPIVRRRVEVMPDAVLNCP